MKQILILLIMLLAPLYTGCSQPEANLMTAIKAGDTPEVKRILLRGNVDTESRTQAGFTALMQAVYDDHPDIVKLLLSHGADVKAIEPQFGFTPLLISVGKGSRETVSLLLNAGADIEAKDSDGETPLIAAASIGYTHIVDLLLENGADIEAEDNKGWTSLVHAVKNGHLAVAKALIGKGARIRSSLPLVARMTGNDELMDMLNNALHRDSSTSSKPITQNNRIGGAKKEKPSMVVVHPGEGVGPISLSMTENHVTKILGDAEERSVFDDDKIIYLNYLHLGISVCLKDNKVSAIFIYSGRRGGYETGKYSRFDGELPHGLDFSSSYQDVVRAFGQPKKSGELLFAPIPSHWISYENLGIGFSFIKGTGHIIAVDVSKKK